MNTVPGLGKTTIEAMINQQKKTLSDSLYSIVEIFKPKMVKTQAAIAGMTQTVMRLNTIYEAGKTLTDTPISDMLDLIFKHTGMIERYEGSNKQEDEDRLNNIKELMKIAKGYEEETKKPTVQDFLDQIALTAQSDKVSKTSDEKVQMMTLHTAKGLEFKVVFLVGFESGILPHASCKDPEEIAEERRLAYVGITRAEKNLYLTSAKMRMDWNRNWQRKQQSEFLDLLPQHLWEEV
ncbi:ATP-dependent DNA helicase UvrD1 [compost metagenome]